MGWETGLKRLRDTAHSTEHFHIDAAVPRLCHTFTVPYLASSDSTTIKVVVASSQPSITVPPTGGAACA
jgi:hypothetical protein